MYGHVIDFLLGLFVCQSVSSSIHVLRFGQLLLYADKHIVKIIHQKEQLRNNFERNNLQVELRTDTTREFFLKESL